MCMTGASLDLDDGTESTYRGPIVIPFWCRLVQAVFSGLLYGYALLLMLVAMAYNPGLFLSLMAGWVIGELLFPTASTPWPPASTPARRPPAATGEAGGRHDCGARCRS